jgi:hypothetical protein
MHWVELREPTWYTPDIQLRLVLTVIDFPSCFLSILSRSHVGLNPPKSDSLAFFRVCVFLYTQGGVIGVMHAAFTWTAEITFFRTWWYQHFGLACLAWLD